MSAKTSAMILTTRSAAAPRRQARARSPRRPRGAWPPWGRTPLSALWPTGTARARAPGRARRRRPSGCRARRPLLPGWRVAGGVAHQVGRCTSATRPQLRNPGADGADDGGDPALAVAVAPVTGLAGLVGPGVHYLMASDYAITLMSSTMFTMLPPNLGICAPSPAFSCILPHMRLSPFYKS